MGIGAWRFDWLRQVKWRNVRPWVIALIIAWPGLPVSIAIARMGRGTGPANFSGGLSWAAIVYALWEPFVAWGLIAAWLLFFREFINRPSAQWEWLGRRAYAVYILHPPVLVGMSLLLHPWSAPALVKFALTGTLSIAATWLISDPLVRLPGVRRVV